MACFRGLAWISAMADRVPRLTMDSMNSVSGHHCQVHRRPAWPSMANCCIWLLRV
jgi:hypothetical protein